MLPKNGTVTLLPVMVYIFGGGFISGKSSSRLYGPGYLLDHDVVLVTMNYRVGPFGFLSTGDSEAPGNFGLKDQVLALQWVKQNVENFGGDPDQVTLFGQSTGSISVHLLTLSDLADGLFHRYILESGISTVPWAFVKSQTYSTRAYKLGEHLGCPTNNSSLLIDCLRGMNFSYILKSSSIFYGWESYPTKVWVPTDEPDLDGAVLTDSPKNLIAAGKQKNLPWICGVNRDDGLLYTSEFIVNSTKFRALLDNFETALPNVLIYEDSVKNVSALTAAMKSYYFNDDFTSDIDVLLTNFTHLASDMNFIFPAVQLVQQHVKSMESPFYFYSFEYRGTFSNSFIYTGGNTNNFGVSHTDELIYLFPQRYSKFAAFKGKMSSSDMKMMNVLVELWTSFAINGVPTFPNCSDDWESYASNEKHLRIGNKNEVTLTLLSSLHAERMFFWREPWETVI